MHFLGDKDLNRDTYCCDSVFEVVGMCDGGWGGGGWHYQQLKGQKQLLLERGP